MSKEETPKNSGPISLLQWRVMEVVTPSGARSRHVWGHNIANSQGRASTAIVAFDSATMTATTASGSLYILMDQPGDSPSGKAAWEKWRSERKIISESDVSSEYLKTLEQQADTTITFTKLRRGFHLNDGQ